VPKRKGRRVFEHVWVTSGKLNGGTTSSHTEVKKNGGSKLSWNRLAVPKESAERGGRAEAPQNGAF